MNNLTPTIQDFQNKPGIQVKEEIVDGNLFYIVSYIYNDNELWKTPVNLEARGLTFDANGKIVSRTMEKFFNIGENQFTQFKDLDFNGAQYFEKLDGCCEANTLILTYDGVKTIKEICDTKYTGAVLGFDHETGHSIDSYITGHSITNDAKQWYAIELEDGKQISLTGNHLVWVKNYNKYVRVDELMVGYDVEVVEFIDQ